MVQHFIYCEMTTTKISITELRNIFPVMRTFKIYSLGREVGGGFRMGNTCTPVADSCKCTAKPINIIK